MSLSKSSSEYFIIDVLCAGSLDAVFGCVDDRNAAAKQTTILQFHINLPVQNCVLLQKVFAELQDDF